jgi:single-strand DNA-binding protein
MAKGFNKVILMGNLTRDPETRQTPNGQSVTNFALAVNRTWKGQDGSTQEQVSFIDCVAWGKTGEVIAQYIQKGRPILVSGRLDQKSWEQDGQKRSKVEVVVEDFNFMGGGDGASGGFSSSSASSSSSSSSSAKNDDVVVEEIDDKPIDLSEIPF